MAKVKRVALFGEYNNNCNLHQIDGLRWGFEALGIETIFGFEWIRGEAMSKFLDLCKPDFVFEINRSRKQIPECEDGFHHIAWIQDDASFPYGALNDITGGCGQSDITYFLNDPKMHDLDERIGRIGRLLHATDPNAFTPQNISPACDVITVGHLAPPPKCQYYEFVQKFDCCGVQTTMEEIHQPLLTAGICHANFEVGAFNEFLTEFMKTKKSDFLPDKRTFARIRARYSSSIIRGIDRARLLHKLVRVTRNVRFFGDGYWKHDELLAPHFYGAIHTTAEKVAANASARIMFHNGNLAMHERVLEAFAMGRPVMLNHTLYDDAPSGINEYFVPGEDFVFYNEDNIEDVTRELLGDKARLARVATNTRRKIQAAHTWRHRAQQILDDFYHG
jgi:spore maturation protein CgeB